MNECKREMEVINLKSGSTDYENFQTAMAKEIEWCLQILIQFKGIV